MRIIWLGPLVAAPGALVIVLSDFGKTGTILTIAAVVVVGIALELWMDGVPK